MKAKPDQNTLMAYLYDELDAIQKASVEAYLSQNPEAAEELQSLKDTRDILSNLDDVHPEIPSFEIPEDSHVIPLPIKSRSGINPFIRNMLATAAMISFLLVVGALTQFKINYQDGNFSLGFGKESTPATTQNSNLAQFSEENVQQLVKQEIDKDKKLLITQLETLNKKINRFQELPKTDLNQQKILQKNEVNKLLEEFKEENLQTMLKLVSLAHEDQQKYTDELVGVFAKYLERRREQDLENIGNTLNDLQINQIKNQQETDRIIVKLIETVNLNNN